MPDIDGFEKESKIGFLCHLDLTELLSFGYLKITNNSFWKYAGLVMMALFSGLEALFELSPDVFISRAT